MATRYADFLRTLQPSWLRDPEGIDALHFAKGDAKDHLVEAAKDAVTSRFTGKAPTDALRLIGEERGLPRASGESDAAFALRLRQAWSIWPFAGTPYGVLLALKTAGYGNYPALATGTGWYHQLDGAGALVTTKGVPLDLGPPGWNTFVLYWPLPMLPAWVSGGIPGAHSDEMNAIRQTVKRWKSAASFFSRIVIQTSGLALGVPGIGPLLGSGTLGGTTVTYAAIQGLALGYPETQTLGGGLFLGLPPYAP